jgi:hypothetical protein
MASGSVAPTPVFRTFSNSRTIHLDETRITAETGRDVDAQIGDKHDHAIKEAVRQDAPYEFRHVAAAS